ncbi:serine/threonine-protein kinase 17A [Toxorhynchites rutilus septentrionalis]|uniref:serine/threonine-protein kinase 17A n=1 Tax=Toxorhynchites rutilus septentrionalis TaxID=329112 RepID=UPI00247AF8E7|nr:serine/threonine-protein kinase 17A [Toxorhynchites rutilus septentrionalis]
MLLPEGFRHVGDGRLDVDEARLQQLRVQQDLAEIYDIEESWFAKGKYGIVRRAVDKKTGVNYAAKFLRRRRRGQCCAKEINHEIAVLMLCANSQHIVRLHAVHETRSETALILELATGGELQTMIDSKGQLSEAKTRTCMREILRALNHLHKQSIAHLDLKPQNILLSGNDVEDGLKLCDFGIARIVEDTGKIYEILGTPDYVAPEVLHYEPLSLRTDIWSIGVLTYVLLTGCSPFGGDNKQETFLNITKCLLTFPEELFEDVSEDAVDFIKSTLRIKPKERPTVQTCLEHRWLTEDTVSKASEVLTASVIKQLKSEIAEQISCPIISPDAVKVSFVEEQSTEAPVYINGHHKTNGVHVEEKKDEYQAKPAIKEEDDDAETNKENLLVQSSPIQPAASVVELVSVSLFPDAPTTPKVSRKAPPSEQQQNGQLHHNNHHGHHNHHHHHHHHHHLHHHSHNHSSNNGGVVMVSSRQTTTTTTTSHQSVKAYVQKFQQQQHQESTTALMLPMENGFCAAAATLCCLKCTEETTTGAAAAGLAVAVATVATRKTLQCGDKGIIC